MRYYCECGDYRDAIFTSSVRTKIVVVIPILVTILIVILLHEQAYKQTLMQYHGWVGNPDPKL